MRGELLRLRVGRDPAEEVEVPRDALAVVVEADRARVENDATPTAAETGVRRNRNRSRDKALGEQLDPEAMRRTMFCCDWCQFSSVSVRLSLQR